MISPLPSYLSLRYESEAEREYIAGLIHQFEMARDIESYHLALFAYHLLFICLFYQIFYKLKIWMPEKHHLALVSFSSDRRKKFREAMSPTDYAHNENKESSFFEFLNIFCDCENVVGKCKALVKYRNNRLGHVNYLLVSEESFWEKVAEYDGVAMEMQKLTHIELDKTFSEYITKIDPTLEITKDDIETDLIIPNKLSDQDLEKLAIECLIKPTAQKEKISKIIQDDFKIFIEIINGGKDNKN
jgi:hypothetical protein